jgi:hypothetical protein
MVEADSVQDTWNIIENKLINIVDKLVPETEFINNITCKIKVPPHVNSKLNKRKNLLKKHKTNKTVELKEKIRALDKEIKRYYYSNKANKVRRTILQGNTKC